MGRISCPWKNEKTCPSANGTAQVWNESPDLSNTHSQIQTHTSLLGWVKLSFNLYTAEFFSEGKPIPTGGHSFIRLVSLSVNLFPLHPNINSFATIHSQVRTGKKGLSSVYFISHKQTLAIWAISDHSEIHKIHRSLHSIVVEGNGIKHRNKLKSEEKQNFFLCH